MWLPEITSFFDAESRYISVIDDSASLQPGRRAGNQYLISYKTRKVKNNSQNVFSEFCLYI